jgi:GNAT superfamily N-acetyltransferase
MLDTVLKTEIICRQESNKWMLEFFGRDPAVLNDIVRVNHLIELHYHEIASNKDVLQLDMNWVGFLNLAKNDFLLVVTARKEGTIVGYFVCAVTSLPHYKTTLVGQEDVHYVHPKYRRQGVGTAMRSVMEEALRQRGAKLLRIRTKAHADNRVWLEKNGFKLVEMMYSKVL